MSFIKRTKIFIRSLWVLALVSLAIEQIIYCLFVSGYFFAMLTSPLFWGLDSLFCFMALWRFNQLHPMENETSDKLPEDLEDLFEFMERDSRWYPLFDPDTGIPISAGE